MVASIANDAGSGTLLICTDREVDDSSSAIVIALPNLYMSVPVAVQAKLPSDNPVKSPNSPAALSRLKVNVP